MIWLVLGVVVGLAIGIYYSCEERCFDSGTAFTTLFLCVIGFVVGSLVMLVSSSICVAANVQYEYENTKTVEISALKDNGVLSERIFLGSGYIEEEPRYFYMENTEFGKHMEDISAENAYINEIDDGAPRIEFHNAKWKNRAWYILGVPLCDTRCQIYIPKGSVTTEFYVDLEMSSNNNSDAESNNQFEQRYCTNCSTTSRQGDRYCAKCGSELK